MKSISKVVLAGLALTVSTSAFAQDLTLVCLSSKKSDYNVYRVIIAEDQLVSIPEESFSEVPEKSYLAMVEIVGSSAAPIILTQNEFAVKSTATELNPTSYKFKNLKNKKNYNCDLELTLEPQPGVIRVN